MTIDTKTVQDPHDTNECCPEFSPEMWDEKTHHWDEKPFLKESMPTFFHIPFYPLIGRKITKMWAMAEKANMTAADKKEVLILFYDPSAFKSELYLSVTGTVPAANNVTLSGTYVSKVFDGPYNDVPKFIKEMDEFLEKQGKKAQKYYIHYAYCPGCAKKFGHNYQVLFAEV